MKHSQTDRLRKSIVAYCNRTGLNETAATYQKIGRELLTMTEDELKAWHLQQNTESLDFTMIVLIDMMSKAETAKTPKHNETERTETETRADWQPTNDHRHHRRQPRPNQSSWQGAWSYA